MQTHQTIQHEQESATQPQTGSGTEGMLAVPENALIIIPVRNLILFPGMILPITIGREASIAAAQQAVKTGRSIGILLQRDPDASEPALTDLHSIGTAASILRYITTQDGSHHLICRGERRFRVLEPLTGYPFLVARVAMIDEPAAAGSEIEARFMRLRQQIAEALEVLPMVPPELTANLKGLAAPGQLADLVATILDLKPDEKQRILETIDISARLDIVLELLAHQIEVLKLAREIDKRTKTSMDERQREFLLREQMKAIQKELGEDEQENATEIAELREAIHAARMPEEVEKQASKELKRLERMPASSAEYSMLRSYLDWLIELPWQAPQPDAINMAEASHILDQDHFGLDRVKKRILEFLAVRKLNPTGRGPILCFAGPPGVGKTSLGQSIAKALGRKFVRVSLGGVHDEAEIRGHRRTYIGALPGNIVQALKKANTRGCVMMLDEIDKLGAGIQGDPAAALLEVLDPEQNFAFRDNYLAVPLDLSNVLFIATANVLDTIPGPLRDRMEIIQLPGYTQEEKREIARRYLLKRQLAENGLEAEQLEISDAALAAIIADYTREAGVRALEREIGAICRKAAVRIAEGTAQHIRVEADDLAELLGPARFENEVALRAGLPGVATGLAWTPVGGDILFVEASRTPGSGKLILTGQLGDVMKESAQAALTLLKSRAASIGIDPAAFDKSDVHIHVPAGAIPKDGPSAGVAMFIALTSLFANHVVRVDTAMTGEISLRGLVLPVGGIKEKVLAALRAGIHRVMLPARNRKDVEEVPAEARQNIEFVFLENVEQAINEAIASLPLVAR